MLVKAETYSNTAPTIASQMISLKDSGANVSLDMSIGKHAVQTILELQNLDWHPVILKNSSAASPESIFTPAGLDKAKGIMSVLATKDPADPSFANDPNMKAYKEFMAKYMPGENANDLFDAGWYFLGYNAAGDNLTHENILKVATNWKSDGTMLFPGVNAYNTPDNYRFFRNLVLVQFDGALCKEVPKSKATK
jgi:branched-chain amino acid transport system substrate-binding protein